MIKLWASHWWRKISLRFKALTGWIILWCFIRLDVLQRESYLLRNCTSYLNFNFYDDYRRLPRCKRSFLVYRIRGDWELRSCFPFEDLRSRAIKRAITQGLESRKLHHKIVTRQDRTRLPYNLICGSFSEPWHPPIVTLRIGLVTYHWYVDSQYRNDNRIDCFDLKSRLNFIPMNELHDLVPVCRDELREDESGRIRLDGWPSC